MNSSSSEKGYSLEFRAEETKTLIDHILDNHSVEMVGMKRVGINSFINFFLSHKDNFQKLQTRGEHLFILVDLDDLIEREIFAFWRLLFKRIVDVVEESNYESSIKKNISKLFSKCIQSGDLFLTYDGVREALTTLAEEDIYVTIFLPRFDRLQEKITQEFFDNLQAIRNAADQKVSYIFTSFRELDTLSQDNYYEKALATAYAIMYIKPASKADATTELNSFNKRYNVTIPKDLESKILEITAGHLQYLQLSLVVYRELSKKNSELTTTQIIDAIQNDERIMLQSEELWESLTPEEQTIIKKIFQQKQITKEEKKVGEYLWETGMVYDENSQVKLFSDLFKYFVASHIQDEEDTNGIEFSKKEYTLFNLLKKSQDAVCEREKIIEVVWPEYKEYGVSDWSIDRLIARVRGKLKKQKSPYEIVTVRTRGYKLVAANA
ncbi:MAG TPA: winged helix-turn-helix domain-containing protein [Patescibacteria group bacterium]